MAVTIKDVAKRAGVSVTTVSRAMNMRGYIAAETQNRILQAMEELNYVPNQLARNLFHSRTRMIGYVVPTVSNPFFAELTQLIEQQLYDAGFHMLLCTTFGSRDRERQVFNMLHQHRVEAIIIGSPALSTQEYDVAGLPVIALDALVSSAAASVECNHEIGGRLAAHKLIDSGCTNVLQIIGNPRAHTNALLRHQTFMQEMSIANLPCISIPVSPEEDFNSKDQAALVERIFALYPGVDGYFATDPYALEILKYALGHGIRVPEDIQIIAYDGSTLAKVSYPQLTMVRQPFELLAEKTVECVCSLVAGKPVDSEILIDQVKLVDGQTTRPAL